MAKETKKKSLVKAKDRLQEGRPFSGPVASLRMVTPGAEFRGVTLDNV